MPSISEGVLTNMYQLIVPGIDTHPFRAILRGRGRGLCILVAVLEMVVLSAAPAAAQSEQRSRPDEVEGKTRTLGTDDESQDQGVGKKVRRDDSQPRRLGEPDDGARRASARRLPPRGWEGVGEEGFISAERSAQEDALQRLGEQIEYLKWTPTRRIAELAARSPALALGLREPFEGVIFQDASYAPDQICNVRVTVSMIDVVRRLQRLAELHNVEGFSRRHAERVLALNPLKSISTVGLGVPSLRDIPRAGPPRGFPGPPDWASIRYRVVGHGDPPASHGNSAAGKLMAASRARSNARSKLDSYTRALPLFEGGTVATELFRRPRLNEAFEQWLGNAIVVGTEFRAGGRAEVELEADLFGLWQIIAPDRMERSGPPQYRQPSHAGEK